MLGIETENGVVYPVTYWEDYKRIFELSAKDCVINEMFNDCVNPAITRRKYCHDNCQYKCIHGVDYKKLA